MCSLTWKQKICIFRSFVKKNNVWNEFIRPFRYLSACRRKIEGFIYLWDSIQKINKTENDFAGSQMYKMLLSCYSLFRPGCRPVYRSDDIRFSRLFLEHWVSGRNDGNKFIMYLLYRDVMWHNSGTHRHRPTVTHWFLYFVIWYILGTQPSVTLYTLTKVTHFVLLMLCTDWSKSELKT